MFALPCWLVLPVTVVSLPVSLVPIDLNLAVESKA